MFAVGNPSVRPRRSPGHDGPAQRERPPEQPGYARDIAFGQRLAHGARPHLLAVFGQQRRNLHTKAQLCADLAHDADRPGAIAPEGEVRPDHQQPHLELVHEQRQELARGQLRQL